MDDKTLCSRCGNKPVVAVVAGEPFCSAHQLEWLLEECNATAEDRITRVMDALDEVLGEPIDGDWTDHLRRLALAAIEAGA